MTSCSFKKCCQSALLVLCRPIKHHWGNSEVSDLLIYLQRTNVQSFSVVTRKMAEKSPIKDRLWSTGDCFFNIYVGLSIATECTEDFNMYNNYFHYSRDFLRE